MESLKKIEEYVNENTNCFIVSKSRKHNVVFARVLFIAIAIKVIKGMTTIKLGEFLNKDHSTVVYYKNTLFNELKRDKPHLFNLYLKYVNDVSKDIEIEFDYSVFEIENLILENYMLKEKLKSFNIV